MMAVKGKTPHEKGTKGREDRLSSLTDDILLEIISRLPSHSAVKTGSLSRRWRNLWKQITSISITNRGFNLLYKFVKHITSSSIHSFSVDFVHSDGFFTWESLEYSMDFWVRQVCESNVLELKVTCLSSFYVSMITLPSVIFETQSLVSIELCSTKGLQLPDDYPISLPNLKRLSLRHKPSDYEWLGTLIKACPSLEELSLNCMGSATSGHYMHCSNQNLRRLFIDLGICRRSQVVIDAPKLEYLAVCAHKSVTFSFEVEPIGLRQSRVVISDLDKLLSDDESKVMSKFYGAICSNMSLTIKVYGSLNMSKVLSILSSLELCPVIEVLYLNGWDSGSVSEDNHIIRKLANVSPSQRVIRKMKIETLINDDCEPTKSLFLQLLEYLLKSARDLEQFHFKVLGCKTDMRKGNPKEAQNEWKVCKLIHQHLMVAKGCNVEFVGRFLNISKKSCSNVWKSDDRVIHFD